MLPASFFLLIPDQHSAQPHVIMVVPYCEHNVHTHVRDCRRWWVRWLVIESYQRCQASC